MQFLEMYFKQWRYFRSVAICLLGTFILSVHIAVADSATGVLQDKADSTRTELERAVSLVESEKFDEAFVLFEKLANIGDPEAQHNLAMMYRTGKGVEKDLQKSAQWFRKAADNGVSDAQYYLGYMYDTGEGLAKNAQYAYVWYRKAAEQGHGLSQINLGVIYANGLGVKQDIEQAYLWFHVAAAQGYKAAFENRKLLEEAMEPEKLEELKKKAHEYVQKYVLPYQRHKAAYPRLR